MFLIINILSKQKIYLERKNELIGFHMEMHSKPFLLRCDNLVTNIRLILIRQKDDASNLFYIVLVLLHFSLICFMRVSDVNLGDLYTFTIEYIMYTKALIHIIVDNA